MSEPTSLHSIILGNIVHRHWKESITLLLYNYKDMKRKKVFVNYVAELIYNVMSIIIPLALTPYISRVLGAAGVGRYGYVQSISIYFCYFAALGTSLYAQREIAMVCGDREKEYQIISDIIKLRIVLSGFSGTALLIIGFFYVQYRLLLWIQVIYVFTVALDVTWYYYGTERFVDAVVILVISRICSFILTFFFVKKENDIWKYALIFAICEAFSQFVLAIPILKIFVINIRRKWVIVNRLKPIMLLFISQISNQIYAALDRTMIVIISRSEAENGYYEQAIKIVAIVRAFLVDTISFVMLPRVAKQFAVKDEVKIRKEINMTFDYFCMIMWPLVFGIIGISGNLIPWFLGEDFLKTEILVKILAFNVIPVGIYTIIGNQLLIPMGKYTKYTESIVVGIMVNFLLNSIMIHQWASVGACYASLASSFVIALYQMYYVKYYVNIWKNIWHGRNGLFASIIMYILMLKECRFLPNSIWGTLFLAFSAVIVYTLVLFVLRDKMIFIIWNIGRDILKKKS